MQSVKAISIHAPCTGSDYVEPSGLAVHTNFNPRSPHGERPAGSPPAMVSASYFNPRSPHGERHSSAPANTSPPGISIHAPRTGSDVCDSVLNSVDSLFQSTLPARGATRCTFPESRSPGISIHAPRTGSDPAASQTRSIWANFNPRSPHGERRLKAGRQREMNTFQPTLPARGATE